MAEAAVIDVARLDAAVREEWRATPNQQRHWLHLEAVGGAPWTGTRWWCSLVVQRYRAGAERVVSTRLPRGW